MAEQEYDRAKDSLEALAELGYPVPCDPEGIPTPDALTAETSGGLEEAEKDSLWEAIERAFVDTTTWDAEVEDQVERAVERIVAAREAAAANRGRAEAAERIAQAIENELVCGCLGEDRHGGGICWWGSAAARIARADSPAGGDR